MAKAKAGTKRGGSKSRTVKKTEEELPSDVEATDDVKSNEDTSGSSSRRGASKGGKKVGPKKSKNSSSRNAVELAFSGESAEEDEGPETAREAVKEPKPSTSKAKRGGSKTSSTPSAPKKQKVEDEEEEEEEQEDTEWEVERILDVKTVNKKREFLIKWKGFPVSSSTWEPEENLQHATDLVDAFLNKVEKGDVSRNRRLSTIQSTKSSASSSTTIRRTQQGRVAKSRSRTPGRSSSAPKSDRLAQISEEKSVPFMPTRREPANGDLALKRYMRESVERKLELLKDKERPKPTKTTLGRVVEKDETGAEGGGASARTFTTKRRFGTLAKTALACGAAAASAAALFFTSPETLNWEHVSPHLQDFVKNVQERYVQLKQNAPF